MKRFYNRLALPVAVCSLFISGCDLLGTDEDDKLVTTGVYVANQGSFSQGNGSVSIYDPSTGLVSEGAVSGLGSIVQSIALTADRLFVLSNTSERIDIFSLATNQRVGQINEVISPRYMATANSRKAYVTDHYGMLGGFSGGKVTVIDPVAGTKKKEIIVGANPEGIAVVGNRVYVANYSAEFEYGAGNTLSVIDTTSDAVVNTITLECDGPRSLAVDEEAELWVACMGKTLYDDNWNVIGHTDGALIVLDGNTGSVNKNIAVDGQVLTAGPGQDLFYAPETRELWVVKDGTTVLRFDTATNTQTGQFGPISGPQIGAVAYDAASERLYLGRVPGFSTSGKVTVHARDGAQLSEFMAGVAPTYITFRRQP